MRSSRVERPDAATAPIGPSQSVNAALIIVVISLKWTSGVILAI
jgi:hypothetical protein